MATKIEVDVSHNILAFIYRLFTPTVEINEEKYPRAWGRHSFELPPGEYEVAVSYPWLFSSECGKNSVRFTLQEGETKIVSYCAGLIRYLPGSISVKNA